MAKRNNNGKRPRARGNNRGMRTCMPYRETILSTLNVTSSFGSIRLWPLNDLFPSLQILSIGRNVVWTGSKIELIPQPPVCPIYFNVGIADEYLPNEQTDGIVAQPYKMTSLVNPTSMGISLVNLKRIIPNVMRTINTTSTEWVDTLALALYTRAPTYGTQTPEWVIRVTSSCLIFPQETAILRSPAVRNMLDGTIEEAAVEESQTSGAGIMDAGDPSA